MLMKGFFEQLTPEGELIWSIDYRNGASWTSHHPRWNPVSLSFKRIGPVDLWNRPNINALWCQVLADALAAVFQTASDELAINSTPAERGDLPCYYARPSTTPGGIKGYEIVETRCRSEGARLVFDQFVASLTGMPR